MSKGTGRLQIRWMDLIMSNAEAAEINLNGCQDRGKWRKIIDKATPGLQSRRNK